MKNIILLTSLLTSLLALATSAFAAEPVLLKTCTTILPKFDTNEKIEMKIQIYKDDKGFKSIITQDGSSREDIALVETNAVRGGLPIDLSSEEVEKLNLSEALINHAIAMTTDPVMEGMFSAGMDLLKVRSATVYTFGEQGNIGMSAIVEAKDAAGKKMGSFLGGFLVSPCK